MTHEADEELLSAYLDGELTADEQAHVEQLLGENQAYRQLYDELRALRTSCEALPRYRLQEDLTREVLRRAERAMLKGTGLAETPAVKSGHDQQRIGKQEFGKQENGVLGHAGRTNDSVATEPLATEPIRLRLPRGWRPWLWPALALAAALLLMVFNPQQERETRKVALAPPADPADIAIGAAPRAGEMPEAAGDQGRIAENARKAESVRADRAADASVKDGVAADNNLKRESEKQSAGQTAATEQLQAPVEKQKVARSESLAGSDRPSPTMSKKASSNKREEQRSKPAELVNNSEEQVNRPDERVSKPEEPGNKPVQPVAGGRAADAVPRAPSMDKLATQATPERIAGESKSAEATDAAKAAPAKVASDMPTSPSAAASPLAVDSGQKPATVNAAAPVPPPTAAAAVPPSPALAGAPSAAPAGGMTLSSEGATTLHGGSVFSNRGSSSLSAGAGGPKFTLRLTPATAAPKGNEAKGAVATQQNGAAARNAAAVSADAGGAVNNGLGGGGIANSRFVISGPPGNNDGVLVVECKLRLDAAESGAFDELLAKNDITFESTDAPANTQLAGRQLAADAAAGARPADARKEVAAAKDDAPGKGAAQQSGLGGTGGLGGLAQQQGLERGAAANNQARRMQQSEGRTNFAFARNSVVPVYVQASRQQIEATLADMQKRADEFVAVNVQPAANADAQQSLTAYNRAAPSQVGRQELRRGQATAGVNAAPVAGSVPPTAKASGGEVGAPPAAEAAKNGTDALTPAPLLAGAAPAPQPLAASPPAVQNSMPQSQANSAQAQRIKTGFGSAAAPADAPGSANSSGVNSGNATGAAGKADVTTGNVSQDGAKGQQPAMKKAADKSGRDEVVSGQDKLLPGAATVNATPAANLGAPDATLRVLFLLQVADPDEPDPAAKPAK